MKWGTGIMKEIIKKSLQESSEIKIKCIDLLTDKIELLSRKLCEVYENKSKLLLFGNGGSAGDAQHVAGELLGHFNLDRPSLPAIALTTDSSVLTCIGNDYSFEKIYSRQIEGLGKKGDMAIGITTSGNSLNVVEGIKAANQAGLFTVGFTGRDGGELRKLVDILINVPSDSTARVQEVHITIFHILCDLVERSLDYS